MSEFQFKVSQRVFLPADLIAHYGGGALIQGVITSRESFIGREPKYNFQFLAHDEVGESGALQVLPGSCAESALIAAQPEFAAAAAAKSKSKRKR